MPYEFGEVVLVRFPFTSQTAFKQRPAVVISNNAYNIARPDAVIMAITSQLQSSPNWGDVRISQWQAANLLKPSAVKPVFCHFGAESHSQTPRHVALLGQIRAAPGNFYLIGLSRVRPST